jgi:hypothetical protein
MPGALMIEPIALGYAVKLTDGLELARFRGPGAAWRARRYVDRLGKSRPAVLNRTPALRPWRPRLDFGG